jgi:BirA family biotin operon repressor/biotin-[acetyl-CoA-carboxylase] ligase
VELPTGRTRQGRARDIDADGRLVVASDDGQCFEVAAGDVVHLR